MNDIFTVEHKGACKYMMGLFAMVHKGGCECLDELFTVVYFLILSLRRILPWLRFPPPFYYLKIVCGQYCLFPLTNITALAMPFALFGNYPQNALSMIHMSILLAA